MRDYIEERAIDTGNFILETKSTVRKAAAFFKVSKSTVHKDMTERLPKINDFMAKQVRCIMESNKEQRHIRGGLATKLKYNN